MATYWREGNYEARCEMCMGVRLFLLYEYRARMKTTVVFLYCTYPWS